MNTGLCIILFVGITMAYPQNSFYATNHRQSYPQVLSRFGDTNVDSRLGDTNASTSTTAPTTVNSNIPTDSLHDPEIVNRVATWPKEHQPFWYLNLQHIGSQREQNVPCTNCVNPQPSLQQPLPQSPFASRRN